MDKNELAKSNIEEDAKKEFRPATLQDFLSKKIKMKEDETKTKDIYVTSMDKTLTMAKPTESQIIAYANELGDGKDLEMRLEANRKLIYNCCRYLQQPEVLEGLELKDPYDIARTLFDIDDVKEIMNGMTSLISNKRIEEEIKN